MTAISLRGVGKTFKQKNGAIEALKNVSLTIEQGEVFGFVGPNGAGKSTTIKIILDIINDYQGEVQLFGCATRDAAARRQVGYVPESPALYEQLSPLEILKAGLSLHQIHRDDEETWCMQWLERFSIAQNARRPLRQLSKGTAQRVALAHAMVVSPRLLILDEPLSGLDPVGRRDVVDILSDYRQQGGTIFLTSHVLHDVERLADRFGLIHQGELRAVRSPVELTGQDESVIVRSQGIGFDLPGMKAEPAGRWAVEVSRTKLWTTLHALEQAGHVIIEIKPTLTLETAFLHVVKGD
jgi:ABC-2 type transport system ATP-binding protein